MGPIFLNEKRIATPKRQIFYSFHFENDVMRVQLIRNMGALEGNTLVSPNRWEEIKKEGSAAIKKWIDDNMKYRSCVVVLVGAYTANRPWVQYEIKKAWNEGKGLVGIYIHNLNCLRNGKSVMGANPFDRFILDNGAKLSSVVKCHNPNTYDAYNDIKNNIEKWVEDAINQREDAVKQRIFEEQILPKLERHLLYMRIQRKLDLYRRLQNY